MGSETERTAERSGSPESAALIPPFLPFSRPSIGDGERRAVLEVLDSGWLTTGPRTKEFERQFGGYVGSQHAVALNSATAALHLALDALGVGPGDEVIVPTWTFASSAEVVVYQGARPVLVDIESDTLNATVDAVLAALTPRTKAVVAVHIAGRPLPVAELVSELDIRGVPVVEDAAHAFPSRIGGLSGAMAGTVGAIGAYSFYATKTITTGEGGMLVTDDARLADRARLMSLHGISRNAWTRYAAGGSWYYEIEDAGFKYNMTDLAAAIGIVQLSRAGEFLDARRQLAARYSAGIGRSSVCDLVELPADAPDGSHAWHLYIVRLRLNLLRIDRGQVIDRLKELGIGTSVHFIPLHLHPYYRRVWNVAPEGFPISRILNLFKPSSTNSSSDRNDRMKTKVADDTNDNWRVLCVEGMWFQDLFNYDFRRTEMCVIPYGTQEGEISFCAYNTGVGWRQIIENMHKTANLAEWYEQNERHAVYAAGHDVPGISKKHSLSLPIIQAVLEEDADERPVVVSPYLIEDREEEMLRA